MTYEDDLDRILNSGGGKSYFTRDSRIGDSVSGLITQIAVRPATDYTTKDVMRWPDGNVKEQIIVSIRAEGIVPEDEDDDLERAVYIKGWGVQRSAFIEATKQLGHDRKPAVGDRFTATFVSERPNPKGGNPAKVYEYRITALEDSAPAVAKEVDSAQAQARKLLELGTFTDEQVAAATGLPMTEVQALSLATPF